MRERICFQPLLVVRVPNLSSKLDYGQLHKPAHAYISCIYPLCQQLKPINIMHTPRRPPPRRADRPLGWQMLHMRLREYNLDGCQTKSNRAISYISNDSQNMTSGDTMRTPL